MSEVRRDEIVFQVLLEVEQIVIAYIHILHGYPHCTISFTMPYIIRLRFLKMTQPIKTEVFAPAALD